MNQKRILKNILPEFKGVEIYGNPDINVTDIQIDSGKVIKGSVFAAFRGTLTDGHKYIDNAILKGAAAVVCETLPDELRSEVVYILVNKSRLYTGLMLQRMYDKLTDSLTLIGVTGTNGKTTIATLLFRLFSGLGYKCGLISTVENRIADRILKTEHTTPDVVSLHSLIALMAEEGCTHIFMEVSSHAAHQERIAGLKFRGAIFSNITHDHLDYHGSFLNYIYAKKKFFDDLDKDAFALINTDDKNGRVMVQNTKARVKTYGLRTMCDYKAGIIESTVQGLQLRVDGKEVYFRLIGEFNAYNLCAVYGAAVECGEDKDKVLSLLSGLKSAEGRFEQIYSADTGLNAIVDYAHTPDALENVLLTIQKVKNKGSSVITVVGCGGDRDKSKRPVMAKVAAVMSDKVILTSDNPRSEDPEAILDDMENGLDDTLKLKTIRITDRFQAIKTALMIAVPGDIILVAGKGHEKYQEIKGEKFPFDDIAILHSLMGVA
jgi:UDP-N-acetylmuramoyl-L-alanyl-D-glutamate--2,6-diaminopimelate ligase